MKVQVEEISAAHQAFDAVEDGVVRGRAGAATFVLVFAAEKFAQSFALFLVGFGKTGQTLNILQFVFAADADRTVFRAEPAGPVARFEFLELVSFGAGIEQDEVGNGAVELAELLAENGAEGGADKWIAGFSAVVNGWTAAMLSPGPGESNRAADGSPVPRVRHNTQLHGVGNDS